MAKKKTTVEIPEDLWRRAKAFAAGRGVGLGDVLAQSLERFLPDVLEVRPKWRASVDRMGSRFRLRIPVSDANFKVVNCTSKDELERALRRAGLDSDEVAATVKKLETQTTVPVY